MLDNGEDSENSNGFLKVQNKTKWTCYYYPEVLLNHTSSLDSENKENKWSSCSSSSSEDSDFDTWIRGNGTTPRTALKIKKKLRARDRDNEIDYILKRKSLQLCRHSSNGSTGSDNLDAHIVGHKRVLSRQSSGSSLMESFNSHPDGGSGAGTNEQSESSQSTLILLSVQHRVVSQIAKHLRANCDKILDMSVPFVVDSFVLFTISEAVNDLLSNNAMPDRADEIDEATRNEYVHQVMFLSDVLEQTPSLCISLSELNSIPGSMDLTLFRNLQVLELRKIPPYMVSGLNTIRINLKKLKCTRSIDSLNEIFSASTSAELLPNSPSSPPGIVFPTSSLSMNLTSVWPELMEIDASFNRIEIIDMKALELTPSLEVLNLSRNRISSIDYWFSRVLPCLTVLNLNYNQLTTIPSVPPTLKVLLISNNYITSLNCPALIGNFKNLEMLDISQNMISDESQLESIRHLISLKSLVCIGNPVAYLDNFRSTLSGNLSRAVLTSKLFILDNKKLSNSEVRYALEKIKMHRPTPIFNHAMTGSSCSSVLLPSTRTGGNRDRICDLKSLTQSYDSNSSSVRSACRKKPKIREIVVLDGDDLDVSFNSNIDTENRDPKLRNRMGSDCSEGSTKSGSDTLSFSQKSEMMGLETRNAIKSLRDKYGNDNWLLRQAGCEVGKLIGITDKVTKLASLSKSLPVSRDSSFYSAVAVASWDNTHSGSLHRIESNDTLGSNSTVGHDRDTSNESIKQVADLSNSFEGSKVYQSCVTNFDEDSITKSSDIRDGIFVIDFPRALGAESELDVFSSSEVSHFRFFQGGEALQLSILDNFLFEVNPSQKDVILSKWDLKSLKAITKEKANEDTDTVTFRLSFDTMRKQLRERTFVMSTKDFKKFDEMANPFLQVRTLQEFFADGFQCVKCNAQFSKGMANVKIVESREGVPKEVHVCPNSECRSDFLIPLESIPLPNNTSFNLAEEELSSWGQQGPRSTTPLSGLQINSLPKAGFFSKSSTSRKSRSSFFSNRLGMTPNNHSNSSGSKGNSGPCESAEIILAGPNRVQKGKSDSDIEVLSCDSSSIEVLAKNGESESSSDIEVEEAVEISVRDFTLLSGKTGITVPMTESNSSGSYAESVCTTYERSPCPTLLAISQQLSPPIHSSTYSSLNVSTSTSFFQTPSNSVSVTCSPSHSTGASNTTAIQPQYPIRYDYENFAKVDHRLQLFCEISIFHSQDEKLLALTKAMVITSSGTHLSIIIFSNKKIYFYKIISTESDKPDEWLQKVSCFPLGKLMRLDVLIGRQGVGLEISGKHHAVIFRDSGRTSRFIEFFLCDICAEIESPPLVRDFSQTQKALMSPLNPISYFGILRFALCEATNKSYSVSAIVVTDQDLILVADLNWLVNRSVNSVSGKHCQSLSTLRQVECLEIDETVVKLVFELRTHVFWDIYFETKEERDIFTQTLNGLAKDIPFISLSQPIEP